MKLDGASKTESKSSANRPLSVTPSLSCESSVMIGAAPVAVNVTADGSLTSISMRMVDADAAAVENAAASRQAAATKVRRVGQMKRCMAFPEQGGREDQDYHAMRMPPSPRPQAGRRRVAVFVPTPPSTQSRLGTAETFRRPPPDLAAGGRSGTVAA